MRFVRVWLNLSRIALRVVIEDRSRGANVLMRRSCILEAIPTEVNDASNLFLQVQ